jgi:hypothetical protein
MLPGADQPQMVRVTLEFQPGCDPPRGRLLADEAVRPLAGRLGLAAPLEHALGTDPGTPPSPAPPRGGQASPNITVPP